MKEYRESHAICNRRRGSGKLPTRVIDVGLTDGSREPRLILSGVCKLYMQRSAIVGGKH